MLSCFYACVPFPDKGSVRSKTAIHSRNRAADALSDRRSIELNLIGGVDGTVLRQVSKVRLYTADCALLGCFKHLLREQLNETVTI
jgi:hypothetical protein